MLKNQRKGKISTSEHQNKHFYTTNQHFFYSKTQFSEVVLKHPKIDNAKFHDTNRNILTRMKIYLDLQKYSNINNHTKQKKGAHASRARTPALQIYDIQKKLFSMY